MDNLSDKDGKTPVTKATGKTLGAATVVLYLLTEWENLQELESVLVVLR